MRAVDCDKEVSEGEELEDTDGRKPCQNRAETSVGAARSLKDSGGLVQEHDGDAIPHGKSELALYAIQRVTTRAVPQAAMTLGTDEQCAERRGDR